MIEAVGNLITIGLREGPEVAALGQVLAQQAVGVFAGAALPGMVRRGEVERDGGRGFDRGIVMKLGAVVRGDRDDSARVTGDELDGSWRRGGRGARRQLAEQEEAGLALDQAEDTVATSGAEHGVDLPVADVTPALTRDRPFTDVALAREPTAAVVPARALPALLLCASEVAIEGASAAPVSPDIPIDGLVTDVQFAHTPQGAGNLLWAPLLGEQRLDTSELIVGEPQVPSGARAPTVGAFDGHVRAIPAPPARIAPELPPNRASVPAQVTGDFPDRAAVFAQGGDHVSFGGGDLVIAHRDSPCLGGFEESLVSRVTSL